MVPSEKWTQLGSAIAGVMFFWAILRQFFPSHLSVLAERYLHRLATFFYPYVSIRFYEFSGDNLRRSEAYGAIKSYLSANSLSLAKRLKAEIAENSQSLIFCLDDSEEIIDQHGDIKLRWLSQKSVIEGRNYFPSYEKRYFELTFHSRHRRFVKETYLGHVFQEGRAIAIKNRQRKLYTNHRLEGPSAYGKTMWSHVAFDHPATFDVLAMEKGKKDVIVADLATFAKSKEYYAKIGKAWKRGYLLHGPPGTGKSTMIACMANLLNYDIYDLELSAVKDNTELRNLLIETSSKSIIVIEDIDCSLDLWDQRRGKKDRDIDEFHGGRDPQRKEEKPGGGVTLSGLLNFLDGLWSCCGEERIIVVTTNFVGKLDAALIRSGRMDRHIEMTFCGYEAFKVLAKNYLDLDWHDLFPAIEDLLRKCHITPADVSEYLISKSPGSDATSCLQHMLRSLQNPIAEEQQSHDGDETKNCSQCC